VEETFHFFLHRDVDLSAKFMLGAGFSSTVTASRSANIRSMLAANPLSGTCPKRLIPRVAALPEHYFTTG